MDKDMQRIGVVEYDPRWPSAYAGLAARLTATLGQVATSIEHIGSTSVPGLAAKAVIDINLCVADAAREECYGPLLVRSGFESALREPSWFEHRMFRTTTPACNLHVFSALCPEVARMRDFRDWLRTHTSDRALYAEAKRALASRAWSSMDAYANAKSAIIREITARMDRAAPVL